VSDVKEVPRVQWMGQIARNLGVSGLHDMNVTFSSTASDPVTGVRNFMSGRSL
jgi:hypothetical protein